jgi:hypothetical protein
MGAEQFSNSIEGDYTVDEAFRTLIDQALWEYGHRGYTGTIAEKSEYLQVSVPKSVSLDTYLKALYRSHVYYTDEGVRVEPNRPEWAGGEWDTVVSTYNDKWGPCIAIKTSNGWIFTGWASC